MHKNITALALAAALAAGAASAAQPEATRNQPREHAQTNYVCTEWYVYCFTEGGMHLHWSRGPFSTYQAAEAARREHEEATGHDPLIDCGNE